MGWFTRLFGAVEEKQTVEPEPVLAGLDNIHEQNSDLIKGWRLIATLNTRTPLIWLQRHGEFHIGPTRPEEALPPEYACWSLETKTWRELGIDADELPTIKMATQLGQIDPDSTGFLTFLIEYRRVVENGGPRGALLNRLKILGTNHRELERQLGGDLPRYFVVGEFRHILECGDAIADKLYDAGYRSVEEIRQSSVEELSEIDGIGPVIAGRLLGQG